MVYIRIDLFFFLNTVDFHINSIIIVDKVTIEV